MNSKTKYYRRNGLFLLIFTAIVFAFVFLVFVPCFQKIKTNYEELSFQKERYLLFKYKKLNIEKLRNDYFRIEPQLKEVENLFLKTETPVSFLNYLEEAGDLSGLGSVNISSISQMKEKDSWPYLSVQISVTSGFSKFLNFLQRLENAPILLQIENLNISKKEDGSIVSNMLLKVFLK